VCWTGSNFPTSRTLSSPDLLSSAPNEGAGRRRARAAWLTSTIRVTEAVVEQNITQSASSEKRHTLRRCSWCGRPNRRQQRSLATHGVEAATVSWLGCDFISSGTPDPGVAFGFLPLPETFGHLHFHRTSSHTTTSTMTIQTSNATPLANPQPPNTLRVADLSQTHHIQTLPLDVLAEIFAYVRKCQRPPARG
jgi:hypothetical protein